MAHDDVRSFEIILANDCEGGWNLYTPKYGDEFVGNYETVAKACEAAVEAAGYHPALIKVL
jgi:hypothetical protein